MGETWRIPKGLSGFVAAIQPGSWVGLYIDAKLISDARGRRIGWQRLACHTMDNVSDMPGHIAVS